ncbi:hypothetical protein GH714_000963 [Hevea brasiliensis]|uniref:Peptidase S8/S53 domain-containing protein n=1 Tax=Hevea brasiliensis TaxID=3981 RepID=A0A6A6M654_HEVBR|nr:hypothetical protein GH714_000963 [Hevea brasiliensis]
MTGMERTGLVHCRFPCGEREFLQLWEGHSPRSGYSCPSGNLQYLLEPSGKPTPYHEDPTAIATFSAIQYGIFVSCAAGNSGPIKSTISNVAPWIMSVGAGSIDKDFPAYIFLGNKQLFKGVSLYTGPRMGNKLVGLVYNKGKNSSSKFCLDGTLEPALVRGKVVICDIGIRI